jgi:hypothetical protein
VNVKAPVSRLRRAIFVAIPVGIVIATIAACGSDRLDATAGNGTNPAVPDRCATPNEGCSCLEPGLKVDCGEVVHTSSDGFVQCSVGHRQCLGGAWGRCVGETDVVKPRTFMAGGGISLRALGAGGPCGTDAGGPANPCDPYCNGFVDDPTGLILEGGLVVTDGGLTIGQPDAGVDGGPSGGFQSTTDGTPSCGGAANIVGPACVPPGLTTCQQDFRCVAATNTCAWNGGPGYYDPLAGGPDLTIGAPCGPSGSGSATAPVCNRGSVAVPAGATISFHVTAGLPSGCANLGAPTLVNVLAAPLPPGGCTNFNLGNSTGNKFITVNAGSPGPVTEAAGLCANNSAVFKDDGAPGCGACGTCDTRVLGKVFDPSGPAGNNLPLAGVTVFQPVGALPAFVDGVACESCASLDVPSIAKAVTDATGSFTLSGVTPGVTIPIVVQSGRWRRQIMLPPVPACLPTTPAAGTFRMPQNRTDGFGGFADIPRTALVMSDNEALECLLLKMGISPSEFASYTAGAPQRIRLFRNNGLTYPGVPAAVPGVFNALNEHTQTIFDCDGAGVFSASPLWSSTSAAQKAALQTYTSLGGKVFMDHLPGQLFLTTGPAPFSGVSSWNTTLYQSTGFSIPAQGRVLTATGPQTAFRDWLQNVGAMTDYGAPYVRADVPRRHSLNPVGAQTTTWIRGETGNNWGANPSGNYALSFSFEMGSSAGTPTVNADCGGIASAHGRVMFNGMHVSQARSTTYPATGAFPGACVLGFGLTPEEKALEFQLFQLTACQLGGAPPPPPPIPPPPLPVVNYQRDYLATCNPGERVKWGPFYWEGVFPPGTSVEFRAATAATTALLPPSPPAAAPVTAAVGIAATTVLAPAWDCTGCPLAPVSVDSQLLADTGTPSKEYLRMFMKFTPTATVPPTLTSWRQIYDCVPAE